MSYTCARNVPTWSFYDKISTSSGLVPFNVSNMKLQYFGDDLALRKIVQTDAWFSYYLQTIMGSRFKVWKFPLKLCRHAYETPEIQSLHQNELFSKKENIDRFCNVLF